MSEAQKKSVGNMAVSAVILSKPWAISILMMVVALFISLSYFNYVNAALILLAILSYTLIYTLFLKRTSPFGTVLGGIPGALPVLIGYTAIKPVLQLDAMIVFIFMMLWQPPHFWVLAQKYKKDYEKAGINVLPVALGTKYTNMLILIYSLSLIPLTFILWLTGTNTVYFAAFAAVSGIYFNYLVVRSVFANRGYGKAFSASIIYMLLIMLGIVVDILVKSLSPVERVIGNLM